MTTETAAPDAATNLEPADIAGKTRAELLEMCRARGLAATAWKKERMAEALLTGEAPGRVERVKKPSQPNALASQLEARRQERDGDAGAEARKARENMLKRTGPCQSASGCSCEAYAAGEKDAFHWQLCLCGHTQWAHAEAAS